MTQPTIRVLFSCGSIFLASTAFAGGVSLPTRGIDALSMGGAFVAGAEGVNAMWYNPSRIDETTLGAEVGLVYLGATYTAVDGEQAGVSVDNDGHTIPNPTLGFILHVTDMLSIGVAAYSPYSGFTRFDETGPQRYSLVASDQTTLLYLQAGAALRLGKFRIGAGLQNVMAHVRQRVVLSGYTGLFGYAEDPELDILEELDLEDNVNLTGNIGASFDMGPVTLGATVQLPYKISGEGAFRVRTPSSVFFDSMKVEGDRIYIEIPVPLMARAGVLFHIKPEWKAELALNYENWSVQDKLTIDPRGRIKLHDVPGIGDYELPALVIDRRMKDTLSVHLGTDYEVIANLHLRGGGFYESSAFGDETFSVAQLDGDKLGLAIGGSYQLGQVAFNLAVSRIFQSTREVRNSELKQMNPTNPDQAVVVGNGIYESGFWAAGFGVTWKIGSPGGDVPDQTGSL